MMSFLDVLESIETGQRVTTPHKQHSAPVAPKPTRHSTNPIAANLNSEVSRQPLNGESPAPNGIKRKADVALRGTPGKPSQPSAKQRAPSGILDRRASAKFSSLGGSKDIPARVASPPSLTPTAKAHPPGSYAALMAEAKAAQEQRSKSQVGLIKHQATSKDRLSKSEKRKLEQGEKAIKAKLGKQPQHSSKVEKRAAPVAKKRPESSYKGTARPAQPISAYKGTAGLPSQHRSTSTDVRHKGGKKATRYDEYLATDEEDEGEESGGGEMVDEEASDASSDMEADAFDLEDEESRALREARADDARELALESKLKRDKEARRKKLEALARKRR
jgi:SPT2 chromatin protein